MLPGYTLLDTGLGPFRGPEAKMPSAVRVPYSPARVRPSAEHTEERLTSLCPGTRVRAMRRGKDSDRSCAPLIAHRDQ